ncbi:MAG: VOC family protein [Elusimicrobia bacterium]|jgi:predicted enzyme related to lactoylglutathione lyase|nr:VOC family protein [Elusimicrobiota bacterium]
MAHNPVGWFEIYVQDMVRAKSFYETVFKTKLDPLKSPDLEMWTFPMTMGLAGAGGALVKMAGVPSGGNSTLVYFNCNDCAEEASRSAQNGGKIFKQKMAIGEHGFIALVVDPDGNKIGLHSIK